MFTEKQATLCQKTTFYNIFKAGLTAKNRSRSFIISGMLSVYWSLQHSSWKSSQRYKKKSRISCPNSL